MMYKKISIFVLLVTVCVALIGGVSTVSAQESNNADTIVFADDVQTRGIYVSVSIELKGNGDGTVSAIAENRFTLGSTVLQVFVELYASETFPYDISEMKKVGSYYSSDLNIFESISTTASTEGKAKYWCAKVMYNKDNKGWESKNTAILLYDANGNVA